MRKKAQLAEKDINESSWCKSRISILVSPFEQHNGKFANSRQKYKFKHLKPNDILLRAIVALGRDQVEKDSILNFEVIEGLMVIVNDR